MFEIDHERDVSLSELGVKHVVSFASLNVRHSFDFSPSFVSVVREIRLGVVAIVCGVTVVTFLRTVLSSRKRPE